MSDYNFLARFWIQTWTLRSAGLRQFCSVHHCKYSVKFADWARNFSDISCLTWFSSLFSSNNNSRITSGRHFFILYRTYRWNNIQYAFPLKVTSFKALGCLCWNILWYFWNLYNLNPNEIFIKLHKNIYLYKYCCFCFVFKRMYFMNIVESFHFFCRFLGISTCDWDVFLLFLVNWVNPCVKDVYHMWSVYVLSMKRFEINFYYLIWKKKTFLFQISITISKIYFRQRSVLRTF